jgi:chromate reductase, NAD(P)H dehydrogenase (quinone)
MAKITIRHKIGEQYAILFIIMLFMAVLAKSIFHHLKDIMTYTIISGTNRQGSNTKKIALAYQDILAQKGIAAQLLALDEVDAASKNGSFTQMQETFLLPAQKFIIIMPEYNGSYPGILKLLIDNSDIKNAWWNKKVLLAGVATGRAGNLRGMEHLTGSLMHIKMSVHHNRLPISLVDKLLDEAGKLADAGTIKAIDQQLEEFIAF